MGNLKPIDSALVKDVDYDLISPDTVGGEYIETIGAACENPDGYTSGSLFLGRENGVQHLYRATAAIALGETIILDNNCVYTTVSGELEGKAAEISSLNEALTNIDSVISANGAKNLLPNAATSNVNNSITYTVNLDGSVSTSGSVASGYSYLGINASLSLKAGTYHLSGTPSSGNANKYMYLMVGSTQYKDTGSGIDFTLNSDRTDLEVYIRFNAGTSGDGMTFKPMITLADQPNSDYAHYVPYAMTNRELTDATHALRTNATNRTLYSNSGTTFVSDSSIALSDNEWTLMEITMYTNNISSGSRSVVLVYKNHIGGGPYIPMIDNSDRTKMAYFRPISYQNKVLSFQASCPVMIIDARPII